jgi:NAD kinase
LRTDRNRDYTYLGRLAYVTHDKEREQPVYFKWQIINWDISDDKLEEMNLNLINTGKTKNKNEEKNRLEISDPPFKKDRTKGDETREFKGHKVDYSETEKDNNIIGLKGEKLVIKYEKKRLIEQGEEELSKMVKHVSLIEGDGAGYDVKSYTANGDVKCIEVKTTKGGKNTPFYITLNEVAFSEEYSDNYYLYRVYNYEIDVNTGKFYYEKGKIRDNFDLKAVKYRAE